MGSPPPAARFSRGAFEERPLPRSSLTPMEIFSNEPGEYESAYQMGMYWGKLIVE